MGLPTGCRRRAKPTLHLQLRRRTLVRTGSWLGRRWADVRCCTPRPGPRGRAVRWRRLSISPRSIFGRPAVDRLGACLVHEGQDVCVQLYADLSSYAVARAWNRGVHIRAPYRTGYSTVPTSSYHRYFTRYSILYHVDTVLLTALHRHPRPRATGTAGSDGYVNVRDAHVNVLI